jgi:hypothetical protein
VNNTGVRVILSPTLSLAKRAVYHVTSTLGGGLGMESRTGEVWVDYPEATKMTVESGALVLYRDKRYGSETTIREAFYMFAPGEWFRVFARDMVLDAEGHPKA